MKTFEYKTVTSADLLMSDEKLNMYGVIGWELVSFSTPNNITRKYVYLFKREIR